MKPFHFSNEENLFPPTTILILLVLLVMISSLIGVGILYGWNAWSGTSFDHILGSLNADSSIGERNQVRVAIIINHLFTFVIPPLIAAVFLFRKNWRQALSIDRFPSIQNAFYGILFLIAALPFAQFTFWLNKQIPLPEWATTMESATASLVNNLLISEYPYELWFNLLVVAVIPAIGEEFVFRGFLQKNLHRLLRNPHLSIWIAAIIFSSIHFQFEGFIPRVVLGALLGYLFYWTKNLWVPIIAHFANNGLQVYAQYLYQQERIDYNPDLIDQVPWMLSLFSVIFVIAVGYSIYHYNSRQHFNIKSNL